MVRLSASFPALLAAAAFVSETVAHPGEHHDEEEVRSELARLDVHARHIARGLEKCAGNAKYQALQARAIERRHAKALDMRKKRGLPLTSSFKTRRDLATLESFQADNHNYTSSDFTTSTAASTLFANYNNVSCVLTPGITWGPYYVSGELVRSNVVDGQEGVAIHLEYQYIDVSTCEPIEGLWIDTWNANSTGVYSGVQGGNGNSNDASNLNKTFLRGIQVTDTEGIAAFDTLFPGHYQGRATHIHLMAHHGGTLLPNNTYQGGNVTHTGQLFFQDELKDAVEATSPYNTNTQAVTTNDEDTYAPSQADNNYDPFPDYAYLGDDITDGLLMWISVGIDLDANYTIQAAAAYTADGGYALTSSMGGSPSGSGPGGNSTSMDNGTAPSGSPPSSGAGGANMTMTAGGNGTAPSGSAPGDANTTTGISPVGGNGTASTGTVPGSSSSSSNNSTTSVATYTGSSAEVARPGLMILAALMVVVMSL